MSKSVLSNISWSFIGNKFDDINTFRNKLIEYQGECSIDLNLDDICFLASYISIDYWCYDGENQVTKTVEVHSDNGITLTPLEVLYKLHNLTVQDLDEIDHHFFQGLVPLKESKLDSPKFKIWQGS